MKSKINIFGISIDNLTLEETVEEIIQRVKKNEKIEHVGVNSSKIVLCEQNPSLKKIVQKADMVNADGYSMVKACKWLRSECIERVTGIDTMESLLAKAETEGFGVFFLGAKQSVLDDMLNKFKTRYPNLKVLGAHNGYFKKEDEQEVVDQINACKPELLFVGITSPYKEEFINRYKDELDVNLLMGVGGSFDVLAGHVKRAPKWMQQVGLEWFYRFSQEPKRLFKRYFVDNFTFLSLMMKERSLQKAKE